MNPLVLVILDGWGMSPIEQGNSILNTPTPNFDQLLSYFPHTIIAAAGEEVGLAWGEMGNSEVGHLNLGTGRIIMQDLPRIDKTIEDGTFFNNPELVRAFDESIKNQSNLHIIGLVSAGGVHSHISHLFALLDLAKSKNLKNVYIHAITDGRDTNPKIALKDLTELEQKCATLGFGKIATVCGRYFAMDRDKNWDRVQKAYEAFFNDAFPNRAPDVKTAIENSYRQNKTDEFIEPAIIENTPRIAENDSIIFFNYRSDRAKEITSSIINNDFKEFKRSKYLNNFYFVSFTSYGYEPTPNVKVAFFAEKVISPLAEIISKNNLSQLHIAETEKYAHVTYFFNAGIEKQFPKENRILVNSPKVATYDLKPEMSAEEVTKQFINYFNTNKPNFSVLNLANPDMVGHTGIYDATCKAIGVVDKCLGDISNNILQNKANLIVTADHGNAEQMQNDNGEPDKEHTTNPVPLILALNEKRNSRAITIDKNYKATFSANPPIGVLADITATALEVLNINKPEEITGQSLKDQI